MLPAEQAQRWHPIHRMFFRLACIYFTCYCLLPVLSALPGVRAAQQGLVAWVGRSIFHTAVIFRPSGSGDTTADYVTVFMLLVIALPASLVWTLLDHRQHYRRLHTWFRVILRYWLLTAMVVYGCMKVVKTQFPDPPLVRLLQPIGEASPMGMLWTFMGMSEPYTVFTGLAELIGGLLLVSRRTTLLGALVCAAALSHVLMLNLSYDVPAKLFSAHLLASALLLIAPDVPRLLDFFIHNRPTTPVSVPQLIQQPRGHQLALIARSVFASGLAIGALAGNYRYRTTGGDLAPRPPLYGIWNVERFTIDGDDQPPLLTNTQRWHRLIIDKGGWTAVQRMNESLDIYHMTHTTQAQQIALSSRGNSALPYLTFSYDQPSERTLILTGRRGGQTLSIRLTSQPEFLLTSRGFHWINEIPYHR